MESTKFKNKLTGEIVTQVPLSDIANYVEADELDEMAFELLTNFKKNMAVETKKDKAIEDLKKAATHIQSLHSYRCGLASDEVKDEIGCGDFFFESPDGQNGELYYELLKLGYRNAGFNAEYYWKVRKDGVIISYTEGDISISEVECPVCNKPMVDGSCGECDLLVANVK